MIQNPRMGNVSVVQMNGRCRQTDLKNTPSNFGNVKMNENKCNLPTSSFQMIAYTLLSVLIAPHHHGVSESVLVYRVKAGTVSNTRNPSCEIVHFSKEKKTQRLSQNYILPALTGANQSTEKTPAAGHFETAGGKKMKKIMTCH